MIFDKPLDAIDFNDVQAFFDQKIPENQHVEYKREPYPLDNEEGRRKFLATVCSFANSYGGHIFIGIDAPKGVPTDLSGTDCDPDPTTSKMMDVLRSWTDPRIDAHTVHIRPIPHSTEPGKVVLIIRVAQSLNAPHSFYLNKTAIRQFYVRHANGKAPMDATELRDAFVLSESVLVRMREFRNERVKYIHADEENPVALGRDEAKCIMHVLPLASFRSKISLAPKKIWPLMADFQPLSRDGGGCMRYNLEGVANFLPKTADAEVQFRAPSFAYCQVYRNGIVEAVNGRHVTTPQSPRTVLINLVEEALIGSLRSYVKGLKKLDISPPAWVFVSLAGANGASIYVDNMPRQIERLFLHLPEFELVNFEDDPGPLLRDTCDAIWNAANLPYSTSFDESLKKAHL